MSKLKCMLGEYRTKNIICYAAECRHCGHERHEADCRKREIHTHGLTQYKDGLRGLAIQRGRM